MEGFRKDGGLLQRLEEKRNDLSLNCWVDWGMSSFCEAGLGCMASDPRQNSQKGGPWWARKVPLLEVRATRIAPSMYEKVHRILGKVGTA